MRGYNIAICRLAMINITLAAAILVSRADERRVAIPEGFALDTSNFAAAVGRDLVAIAIHSTSGKPESRVLQIGGDGVVATDFRGRVFGLEYSPAGDQLLARVSVGRSPGWTTGLVDGEGRLVWERRNDRRSFAFSSSGESISAFRWELGHSSRSESEEVELFSGDGTSLGSHALDEYSTSVVAIGRGGRIVAANAAGIRWVDLGTPPRRAVEIDLQRRGYVFGSVQRVGDRHLLFIGEGPKEFWLFDLSGNVLERFDASWSNKLRPGFSPQVFESLQESPSPDEGKLYFFAGSAEGFVLDLTDGHTTARIFNTEPPPGFRLVPRMVGRWLLFVSPNELILRSAS